jgi:hypothetical protein
VEWDCGVEGEGEIKKKGRRGNIKTERERNRKN